MGPQPLSGAAAVAVVSADAALGAQALRSLLDGFAGDDIEVAHTSFDAGALSECSTVPMFAARRVVVVRDAHTASKDQHAQLDEYLSSPAQWSTLVLGWGAAKLPKALTAHTGTGALEVRDANPPANASGRTQAIIAKVRDAQVRLDGPATKLVVDTLGEDLARVDGVLAVLAATYPEGSTLNVEQVRPYLGDGGPVPPWELCDSIASGDSAAALEVLSRLLDAGGRHPLAVLAVLRTQFERMQRIAFTQPADDRAAAELLGIKGSVFPAKKARAQARRLGADRACAALELIGAADGALKGRSGVPERMLIEVLVARLAALHR